MESEKPTLPEESENILKNPDIPEKDSVYEDVLEENIEKINTEYDIGD